MKKDNTILFGRIIKPHGVKGEVRVELKVTSIKKENLESVFIDIDGKLVPFFLEHFNDNGPFAVVKFEGVDNFEMAAELKSKSCYLETSEVSENNEMPALDQLVSFEVEDNSIGDLGVVTNVEEGAQARLVVDMKGKEIMIPFVDHIIKEIDAESKRIWVDLPEGFLDIYE